MVCVQIGTWIRSALMLLTAAVVLNGGGMKTASAGDRFELSDAFEKGPLDTAKWSTRRIGERRFWIDRHTVHSGTGSLAIRVTGRDFTEDCQCQQNEIREAPGERLNFGDDAWYRFSMRITGNFPAAGAQRWVIGGWKQETNGSAFVAQRFDRGVFHITLESGNTRVLLASAQEPASTFSDLLKNGLGAKFSYVADHDNYKGESDVKITYGDAAVLPDPSADWVEMLYHIRGGLNGTGLIEVFANGQFIARAEGTIGVEEMGGPTQYMKLGHNRAPMPGAATLFIDDFRRGATREAISAQ